MQLAFSKKFTYDREGPAAGRRSGWASTSPRSPSTRPASRRGRCGAPRCAGSPARRSSSAGTSCPLVSDEFRRVEIGFLLAAGVLFALLYYVYRRPHERAEDVPEPGSPEELEARLAMLDEQRLAEQAQGPSMGMDTTPS